MKTRRLLSFLIAMLLALSCAGLATAATVVEIGTAQQLETFRNRVNGGENTLDARLTADITLAGDWTPIGTDTDDNHYNGTFDGNGKAISGLVMTVANIVEGGGMYDTVGFFGVVGVNGVVKNLKLSAPAIDTGDTSWLYVGTVVGYLYGQIENCSVTGGRVAGRNAGGIVGNIAGADGAVSGCTVSGIAIIGKGDCGGVAAENRGAVINCAVSGATTTIESTAGYVGGIVGSSYTSILNCTVSGVKSIVGSNTGGIVGSGGYQGAGEVTNCTATLIESIQGDYQVGGIAGDNDGTIANCTASEIERIAGSETGGVAGYNSRTITNSTAKGIGSITADDFAGGVVGYSETGTITNSRAADVALIYGIRSAGGVAGENRGKLSNCFAENISAIYCDSVALGAGGVVGYNRGQFAEVLNCALISGTTPTVLSGDSESCEGGVIGNLENGALWVNTIQNCRYPSNVIFTHNDDKPIGNIAFYNMGQNNVASYDANVINPAALSSIIAAIEQGVSRTMLIDETYDLSVTTLPGTEGFGNLVFAWQSSNAGIVSVSSATDANVTLTAEAVGTATVTCKVTGGLTAELTFAVRVVGEFEPEPEPEPSVDGMPKDRIIYLDDEVELTYDFSPYEATDLDTAGLNGSGLTAAIVDGKIVLRDDPDSEKAGGPYSFEVQLTPEEGERIWKTVAFSIIDTDRPTGGGDPDDVDFTDITINGLTGGTITLNPDGTFQITFTTDPANASQPLPTYDTSDGSVAIVSATGLVTAVGEGTATIEVTVTTLDGQTITKTFTVVVSDGSTGTSRGGGSSNCSAFGFGLLMLAALPFVRGRKK